MASHPLVRGEPWVIPAAVFDAAGDPVDITDWTIVGTFSIPSQPSVTLANPTVEMVDATQGTFNFVVAADAPAQTTLPEGQRSVLVIDFDMGDAGEEKRSIWLNVRVAEHYAVQSADGDSTLEA